MKTECVWLLGGVLLWAASASGQPTSSDGLTYKTSLSSVRKLGRDLQKALKPAFRDKVNVEPVSIETGVTPFIRPEEYPDDVKPMPIVFISVGFIDLVNNVAHAKAIDRIEKGYFQKYVTSLAKETGEHSLPELPNLSDQRFWSDDVLNEQLSNFNSIVGTVIAIQMADHYLGYYHKYEKRMQKTSGDYMAINNLLTEKEWEDALSYGARNAMDAGCMIEGVLAFFETFEKMPARPAWTAYFVPDKARYKAMAKSLEKLQKKFFAGQN